MVIAREPPPPPAPPPASDEAEGEPELPDGVYRKEISEEQLSGFYEAAHTSHEGTIKFLADVLGLRDISHKARNAIIVDYFCGFLLFAKEAELTLEATFHVWKLSHDMLDIILEGASIKDAERHFKFLVMKITVCTCSEDVIRLTLSECRKIEHFFTTTIFQHYALLSCCFLHDHAYCFETEQLWVQTPLLYPHNLSSTQEEIDAEKAAWEAYEIALVVYDFVEQLKFKAVEGIMETPDPKDVDLKGLPPDEYVNAVPETIDQCIERICRNKIEEAMKLFHDDYLWREVEILKKIITLEVKCGLAEPRVSVMKFPEPPAAGESPLG